MSIIFDNATSADNGSGSYTYTHTLGAGSGSNRLLVVVICPRGPSNTVTGATYNGASMTRGPETYVDQYGYRLRATMFYMLDAQLPSSAGSYSIAFTVGGTVWEWISGAVSVSGAYQGAPESTVYGTQLSGSTMSVSLPSVSDQSWCFDGLLEDLAYGSGTPDSGQVERWDRNRASCCGMGSTHAKSGSGSRTMGWTFSGSGNSCAQVAAAWAKAGSGSPTVVDSSQGNQSGTTCTVSHTCSAGSNRKLIVFASGERMGATDITGVTYNGQALTKVTEIDLGTTYQNCHSAWYLDDADFPGTPGAYNVVASYSDSVSNGIVHIVELNNAAQGDPEAYNTSTASSTTTISTSVTTQNDGSLIVGGVSCGDVGRTFSPTTGQTELEETDVGGGLNSAVTGAESIATAGSESMAWLASASCNRLLQILLSIGDAGTETGVENSPYYGANF